MERKSLGLITWASHLTVTSDARQAGDGSTDTDPKLHLRPHGRPPLMKLTHLVRPRVAPRPRTTTAAPPHLDRSAVDAPIPAARLDARDLELPPSGSRVHCDSLDEGGARLCPCGIAMSTPQTFPMASRSASANRPRSSPPAFGRRVRTASCPDPPGSSRRPVKGLNDVGSSRTPLHHAHRTRTIWQYWHVPALSGLLPPSPASPGPGCPQLHRPATTGRRRRSSTSTQITAPHGARR